MSKHTPGPWTAVRDPNAIMSDDWCIGAQGQIDHVAVCSERDARLIAAAPDLLNAVCFLLSNPDNRISKADRDAAYNAIAKATGETLPMKTYSVTLAVERTYQVLADSPEEARLIASQMADMSHETPEVVAIYEEEIYD